MLKLFGEVYRMLNFVKEKFLNRKFLTFAIIGGFNTFFSQALYIFFVTLIALSPGTSSILGDVISMVFSYFLNMHFTYRQKPTLKTAMAFPLSYVPGFIINYVCTVAAVAIGVPEVFAKLVSLPITVPVNFLCMNVIVKKSK